MNYTNGHINRFAMFILLILINFNITKSKIDFNIKRSEFNTYSIKSFIGKPSTIIDLTVCLEEDGIILYSNAMNDLDSENIAELEYQNLKESLYLTSVYFENGISSSNMHILVKKEKHSKHVGLFGITRNKFADNSSNSFLSFLFSKAKEKKLFYINTRQNILSIGDYPDEFYNRKNINSYKYCNIDISEKKGFKCRLDSIYFKSNNNNYIFYQVGDKINFDINTNGVFVSLALIKLLEKNYFNHLIKKGKCELNKGKFKFIFCKKDLDYLNDNLLTDLTFVFENKYSIRLSVKELFIKFEGDLIFVLVYSPDKDGWYFGYPFFKKFTTIFDLTKNQIGFIPNEY